MLRRTFVFGTVFAWFMKPVLGKIQPKPPEPVTLTCVKPLPPGLHLVPIEYIKIDEKCSVRALDEYSMRKLAESIQSIGLKNPIAIFGDGRIIDGQHRFIICKHLKMTHVQCYVCVAKPIHLSNDMWMQYTYRA